VWEFEFREEVILITDFSTLNPLCHRAQAATISASKKLALLTGCGKEHEVVGLRVWSTTIFFLNWYKCTFFQLHFVFSGVWLGTSRIWNWGCMFVYVPDKSGHKIWVKWTLGVGGGGEEWLRTYVCEDQRWYCLVELVGDYLLVYFLLDCDVTSGSNEGYSVRLGLFRMDFFSLKNCTTYLHRTGASFWGFHLG
jgi:hypothetical protein